MTLSTSFQKLQNTIVQVELIPSQSTHKKIQAIVQQPQTSLIHFLPREFSSFQIPLCNTHPCTHTHASSNLWNWANWFQCVLFYREEICLATEEEEDDEKQKERGKSPIMKSISPTHEFHSCDLCSNFLFFFKFCIKGAFPFASKKERTRRERKKKR